MRLAVDSWYALVFAKSAIVFRLRSGLTDAVFRFTSDVIMSSKSTELLLRLGTRSEFVWLLLALTFQEIHAKKVFSFHSSRNLTT